MGLLLDHAIPYLKKIARMDYCVKRIEHTKHSNEKDEITKKGYAPTPAKSLDGKPGGFNADDYYRIPWPCVDPLYTGRRLKAELHAIEVAGNPSPQGGNRAPLHRARRAGVGTPYERNAMMAVESEAEGKA